MYPPQACRMRVPAYPSKCVDSAHLLHQNSVSRLGIRGVLDPLLERLGDCQHRRAQRRQHAQQLRARARMHKQQELVRVAVWRLRCGWVAVWQLGCVWLRFDGWVAVGKGWRFGDGSS
eukprot:114881-Chlamydomonas_euryale.AAC.1